MKIPISLLMAPPLFLTLTSCVVITGEDPAEKLSTLIELNSKKLRSSGEKSLEFEYSPNITKIEKSPKYDGSISLAARKIETDPDGHSTIQVADWFTTSYHNRFVKVFEPMEAVKKEGEFF